MGYAFEINPRTKCRIATSAPAVILQSTSQRRNLCVGVTSDGTRRQRRRLAAARRLILPASRTREHPELSYGALLASQQHHLNR
jgi:hypothetical protein